MKHTDQTLLEQMRITDIEISNRKALLSLTPKDVDLLKKCKNIIESKIDDLVSEFYEIQTGIVDIALLIGDADTLNRLKIAQRKYILDLFSGVYDLEYVNYRLRIGLVHKRIGVEPKLYLSAVSTLKSLLNKTLLDGINNNNECERTVAALDKLFTFDVTLIFETYIRSLVSEIESSKIKSDQYALALEETVKERTKQLEELSRTDALTGLFNVRHLFETLTTTLRAAQRRSEPICLVYLDINDFKIINDTKGHHQGDEILRIVGETIKKISRHEDSCFRYGGDEFCVILPNCDEDNACEIYMTRLKHEVHQQNHDLTLSVGIIQTGPNEYMEADALIREADRLMYADKKAFKEKQGHA